MWCPGPLGDCTGDTPMRLVLPAWASVSATIQHGGCDPSEVYPWSLFFTGTLKPFYANEVASPTPTPPDGTAESPADDPGSPLPLQHSVKLSEGLS